MQNKRNSFFYNRGFPNWGGGGSAAWEFFPHNPVFFSDNDPQPLYTYVFFISFLNKELTPN